MASNPALQPWFDFDNNVLTCVGSSRPVAPIPQFQPCSAGGQQQNCSVVCQNATTLFNASEPQNLLNCGLWATACSSGFPICANATQWAAHFEPIGLTLETPRDQIGVEYAMEECPGYVGIIKENIASCATDFYAAAHQATNDDQFIPLSCTTTGLFASEGVESCFKDLCSARTLDTDIGGIGVRQTSLCLRDIVD